MKETPFMIYYYLDCLFHCSRIYVRTYTCEYRIDQKIDCVSQVVISTYPIWGYALREIILFMVHPVMGTFVCGRLALGMRVFE